jgi:hypothetical protein
MNRIVSLLAAAFSLALFTALPTAAFRPMSVMDPSFLQPEGGGGYVSPFESLGEVLLEYSAHNVDGQENATLTDGQAISTWVNGGSLGSAYDAVYNASYGGQPTFVNSGSYPLVGFGSSAGSGNGKNVIAPSGVSVSAPFTIIVVAKTSSGSTSNGARAFRDSSPSTIVKYVGLDGNPEKRWAIVAGQNAGSAAFSNSSLGEVGFIGASVPASGTVNFKWNASTSSGSTTGTVEALTSPIYIGTTPDYTGGAWWVAWAGSIMHIVVIEGAVSLSSACTIADTLYSDVTCS